MVSKVSSLIRQVFLLQIHLQVVELKGDYDDVQENEEKQVSDFPMVSADRCGLKL